MTVTLDHVQTLAGQLSPRDQARLIEHLSRQIVPALAEAAETATRVHNGDVAKQGLAQNGPELLLPEHATVDEALAIYLSDACSLGRAAEIAGVTRWDLQDRLREHGIPIIAAGEDSAEDMDALAAELEREGAL